MIPDVEKYLIAALSDPNWEKLIKNCEDNLSYADDTLTSPPSVYPNSQGLLTYDIVAYTDFLDINKWLTIDENGRKHLDEMRLINLDNFLRKKTKKWYDETELPMSIRNGVSVGPKKFLNGLDCVDMYGGVILENLSTAQKYDLSAQIQ